MLQDIYVREKLNESEPPEGERRPAPVGPRSGSAMTPLLHSLGRALCYAGEKLQSAGSGPKFDTRGKKLGSAR
jgi:hypothetical protein